MDTEGVYRSFTLPPNEEQLAQSDWVAFSVNVELFNEKELKTGLRDISLVFSTKGRGLFERTPLDESTRQRDEYGETVVQPDTLEVIDIPSREWIRVALSGGLHRGFDHDKIQALAECDRVMFKGYFPDGREFQRKLQVKASDTGG